jgi:MFS transporter, OFA family, oxalate/formate antiporter
VLSPTQRTAAAIASATVLNLPFGTVYAYSVFLKPVETLLAIGRTQMSLVFSLAAIFLTVGMLIAPVLYRHIAAIPLLLAAGSTGALGLVLTASADGLVQFALGYGVVFGIGGGVCFTLVQQGVNQTVTKMSGLTNGYVVSLFPLGAMIAVPIFGWTIERHGVRIMFGALAVTVLIATLITAALFRMASIRMVDTTAPKASSEERHWPIFLRLFAVFFLAAAAGLMVMSQAAGIMSAYGGQTFLALGATTFITGLIGAARIGGGWLVDRFAMPHVACAAHACSLTGALLLTLWPGPLLAILALSMIGMGYGFISGSTAGAIAQYWHKNAFGRVAGQMYIAWCLAAISLPVLAGWLFDRTQGYGAAVIIAAGGNVLGILIALSLPSRTASAAPWRRSRSRRS